MDFAKIQKLVLAHGEKFVIVQDGEPAMVVMSFSDYERLAGRAGAKNGAPPIAAHEETLVLPSRQDEWQVPDAPETEFIADEQSLGVAARPRIEEIRLEDLPL